MEEAAGTAKAGGKKRGPERSGPSRAPRPPALGVRQISACPCSIDELMTWRELAGDGRLAKALEACEENGWEAVPLAPQELTRLFPPSDGPQRTPQRLIEI
jgi:hypothetical protein